MIRMVYSGRMFLDDGLNMSHSRAGGINDFQALFLDRRSFLGRYAVGANHKRSAGFTRSNLIKAADGVMPRFLSNSMVCGL